MGDQSSTKAFIARLDTHGNAMNFPRVREVLLERDEGLHLLALNNSEGWKANRVIGVHHQRVFNSEPHRKRPQHFLALSSLVQSGAYDLHFGYCRGGFWDPVSIS